MKKNITFYTAIVIACGVMACSQQLDHLLPDKLLSDKNLSSTEQSKAESSKSELSKTESSNSESIKEQDNNISFLAFGDGGYHPDYPKLKHIKNPKNKAQFIKKNVKIGWKITDRLKSLTTRLFTCTPIQISQPKTPVLVRLV